MQFRVGRVHRRAWLCEIPVAQTQCAGDLISLVQCICVSPILTCSHSCANRASVVDCRVDHWGCLPVWASLIPFIPFCFFFPSIQGNITGECNSTGLLQKKRGVWGSHLINPCAGCLNQWPKSWSLKGKEKHRVVLWLPNLGQAFKLKKKTYLTWT